MPSPFSRTGNVRRSSTINCDLPAREKTFCFSLLCAFFISPSQSSLQVLLFDGRLPAGLSMDQRFDDRQLSGHLNVSLLGIYTNSSKRYLSFCTTVDLLKFTFDRFRTDYKSIECYL